MKKKTATLINVCIGAAGTVASAVVAYFAPANHVTIIAVVGIVVTAATNIVNQFTKAE
jgi:hypothetical protein